MKNIAAIILSVLCFAGVISAQSEGFIGYTVGYGPARVAPELLSEGSISTLEDQKAWTHGITAGYTYFFKRSKDTKPGKVGLGTDLNLQFHDGRAATSTWVAGLVVRGRTDQKVQPFVRAMAGVGRLGFRHAILGLNLHSTARYGPAYVFGAGIDIKKGSRLKWRIGGDYVLTTIGDRDNQQYVRFTTGLVF